jgi:hypothetical protein
MRCDVLKRSAALWVLSRDRDNTHNAEHRIMPRMPVNRLSGKGFRSTRSA